MHETALARSLIAVINSAITSENVRVTKVNVSVGTLAGVLPDALEFAFEAFSKGTKMQGARLFLEEMPVRLKCRDCAAEYESPAPPFICPKCGSVYFEITGGEEVFVKSVETQEEENG